MHIYSRPSFSLIRFEIKEPRAFSWNDVMAIFLNVWRHIMSEIGLRQSMHLLEEQYCQISNKQNKQIKVKINNTRSVRFLASCQISPRSDFKRQSLRLFLKSVASTTGTRIATRSWVAILDQFLIQDCWRGALYVIPHLHFYSACTAKYVEHCKSTCRMWTLCLYLFWRRLLSFPIIYVFLW